MEKKRKTKIAKKMPNQYSRKEWPTKKGGSQKETGRGSTGHSEIDGKTASEKGATAERCKVLGGLSGSLYLGEENKRWGTGKKDFVERE